MIPMTLCIFRFVQIIKHKRLDSPGVNVVQANTRAYMHLPLSFCHFLPLYIYREEEKESVGRQVLGVRSQDVAIPPFPTQRGILCE